MKICLFIGPSLPKETVQKLVPNALVCGPTNRATSTSPLRQLGADVVAMVLTEFIATNCQIGTQKF